MQIPQVSEAVQVTASAADDERNISDVHIIGVFYRSESSDFF